MTLRSLTSTANAHRGCGAVVAQLEFHSEAPLAQREPLQTSTGRPTHSPSLSARARHAMFGRVPGIAAKVDFMRSCRLLFPELAYSVPRLPGATKV